jgi:DNA-binding response OmpR family regulator
MPPEAVRVLLVVRDGCLRREWAAACQALSPAVHCDEAADAADAVFAAVPGQLDLVVLDVGATPPPGTAWVAHWRRLAPRGQLLLLNPAQADAAQRLCCAVRGLVERRGAGAA